MATCTPLAIFAFNRACTLGKVLKRLARCDNLTGNGSRPGYAFIDGARTDGRHDVDAAKITAVKDLLETFKREHFHSLKIVVREYNHGNAGNIQSGIAEVLQRHGRIAVLEDDVLVSGTFLNYMDSALEKYRLDPRIWCINSWRNRFIKVPRTYCHDVYLSPRNMCWGWGTWKDRWDSVDFSLADWPKARANATILDKVNAVGIEVPGMLDAQLAGRLGTWDVQCTFHMVINGLYAVEPRLALTKNIGFGLDGAHCTAPNITISSAPYYNFNPVLESGLVPDPGICRAFRNGWRSLRLLTRIKRKILRGLWYLGPSFDDPLPVR